MKITNEVNAQNLYFQHLLTLGDFHIQIWTFVNVLQCQRTKGDVGKLSLPAKLLTLKHTLVMVISFYKNIKLSSYFIELTIWSSYKSTPKENSFIGWSVSWFSVISIVLVIIVVHLMEMDDSTMILKLHSRISTFLPSPRSNEICQNVVHKGTISIPQTFWGSTCWEKNGIGISTMFQYEMQEPGTCLLQFHTCKIRGVKGYPGKPYLGSENKKVS